MRAPDSLIFSLWRATCLALLAPLIALAQGPDSLQDAANPAAPGALLVHPGMTPLQQGGDAPAPNAWRDAHDAVSAFPRGHADILAWEQQTAAKLPLAPASAPSFPGGQPHAGHGAQPMQPHQHMPGVQGHPAMNNPTHKHMPMQGGKP